LSPPEGRRKPARTFFIDRGLLKTGAAARYACGMRSLPAWLSLALLLASSAPAAEQFESGRLRSEIEEFLRSEWQAIQRRDTLTLEELRSPDWFGFSHLSNELVRDREEWRRGLEIELERADFLSVELNESAIRRLDDDLVVVAYTLQVQRREKEIEVDLPLRGLSVLRRGDRGGWVEIAGSLGYSPAALPVLFQMNLEQLFEAEPEKFKRPEDR